MCKYKNKCQLEVKLNTVMEITGHMTPKIARPWSCKTGVSIISLRFSRSLLKFPFIAHGTSGAEKVNIKTDLRYRLIIDVDVVFSCLLVYHSLLYRQGPECVSMGKSKSRRISSGYCPSLLRGTALHIIHVI